MKQIADADHTKIIPEGFSIKYGGAPLEIDNYMYSAPSAPFSIFPHPHRLAGLDASDVGSPNERSGL